MANDLNKCMFIGRLGKDPEVKQMSNGKSVANFSVACGWKGKDTEGTEWVPCVAYDKLAEIIGHYLTKGSQVYIEGKMRTRKWQKDGVDRYTTEIAVDQMQMLGGKSEGGGGQRQQGGYTPQRQAPKGKTGFDDMDDHIPF